LNQRRQQQQQRKLTIAGQHSKPSSGLKLNSRVIFHVARQLSQPPLTPLLHLRLRLHLHLPNLLFQRHLTPTTHMSLQSRHTKDLRAKTRKGPKTATWLHRLKARNMCLLICATATLPVARLLCRKNLSNRCLPSSILLRKSLCIHIHSALVSWTSNSCRFFGPSNSDIEMAQTNIEAHRSHRRPPHKSQSSSGNVPLQRPRKSSMMAGMLLNPALQL